MSKEGLEQKKTRGPRVDYNKLDKVGKQEFIPEEEPAVVNKQTGSGNILSIFSEEECIENVEGAAAIEDESAQLEQELRALEEEEERLLQKRKVEGLKRKVEEKKRSVQRLRGEANSVSFSKCLDAQKGIDAPVDLGSLTIQDLRKDKKLRDRTRKVLRDSGLNFINDSGSSSSSSVSDSDFKPRMSKKLKQKREHKVGHSMKKKNVCRDKLGYDGKFFPSSESCSSQSESESFQSNTKLKSGILATPSDHVKFRQRYPQAFLRFEHVNSSVSFEKLDFNLFVAGELEIISSSSIKSVEKKARLELLKRLMYLNSSYEFSVVKNLYAAILREIELGKKSWGDDFQYVETSILNSRSLKRNFISSQKKVSNMDMKHAGETQEPEDKAWFCSLFQRNKCAHKSSHTLVVKGKMRLAQHICATCYQKDKNKLEHPECSSACPHAGARA